MAKDTELPDLDGAVGRRLLEDGPDAVIVLGPDHRIRRFNPAAEQIFGYREAELVGESLDALLPPDVVETHPAHLRAFALEESGLRAMGERKRLRGRRRDGSEFPLEATIGRSGEQTTPSFFALVRDVSEQVAREQALERQRNLYHALSQSNQLLIETPPPMRLYTEICRIVVESGGLALAWVGLVDETGTVEPVACHGAASEYLSRIRVSTSPDEPEGRGPGGTSIREGRHVLIPHLQQDPAMAPWHGPASKYDLHSVGSFPIRRGGQVIGAILVYSADPEFFATDRVALIDELAADMGAALDHFDQQQENQRLREIVEASPDLIGVADAQGRIVYVNPATRDLIGDRDPTGWDLSRFHPPQALARIEQEAFPAALRDGQWQGEVAFYRPDGSTAPFSQVIVAHRDAQGQVHHFSTIARDITQWKQAQALIEELAYRNPVTRLPNRASLRERLAQEARRLERHGGHGAVVHLDLDGFKTINDSLGTDAGDEILRALGARLSSQIRPEDVVAHLGGDELVVLLLDLPPEPESAAMVADRVAEKLRVAIGEALECSGRSFRITAGIGVTLFPEPGGNPDRLLQESDMAVDRAKQAGGDTVRFYEPAMLEAVREQLDLEHELREALARQDLHLVYQPLWDLAGTRILGLEALARWDHPERGAISPGEFIPLAERTGLILTLGDWVLEQVLAQAERWVQQGFEKLPLGIAINVSPRQFGQDDWVERVRERLAGSAVGGGCLKLELTESLLMENLTTAATKMGALRPDGVSFALDDFGTGYSSLSYLQELPLDYIKIDRSFVQRIGESERSEGIIEAILAMAGHLDLQVIAEGVETAAQAAFLAERDCQVGQGFYWAKPLTPAEVEPFLPRSG